MCRSPTKLDVPAWDWPEAGIAAVDLFVCGVSADAEAGLATIVQMLDAKVGEKNVLHRLQR